MKTNFLNKKFIITVLLLILVVSNFTITFAFWASHVAGSTGSSNTSVQIGQWDFTDPETELAITTFLNDHAYALSLTTLSVTETDRSVVEDALSAYGLLSEAAKAELTAQKSLLLDLLTQIIVLENSEFLDFEAYPYDSGLTGTVVMNGRTWYGSGVYISNDSNYDVWLDTRSLALKSGAYFESRDLFINGIDKITIYHGALNYDNGTSFAFKVEYALSTAPSTWLTLQEGGSDLIIDVISGSAMTYTEINVNIFESVNIRFTPVIGNTTDYINLDNIKIFEHIVSSNLEVTTFRTVYAGALALTPQTVTVDDKEAVDAALSAYDLLSTEAQTTLTPEKALLDQLMIVILEQEAAIEATEAVVLAEQSFEQVDLDVAQLLVSALPDGTEKTNLQNRLDALQITLNNAEAFRVTYQDTLALTVVDVTPTDKPDVDAALAAYESLSANEKLALANEKAHLDSLLQAINSQLPTSEQVAEFRSNHQVALALTINTVELTDLSLVEAARDAYDILSFAAQQELLIEKALLDDLYEEIMMQQALQDAETAVLIAESTFEQTDVDTAQLLINAVPDGQEKDLLQQRLDLVQDVVDAVLNFRTIYENTLDLTTETVSVSDKPAVEAALAAFGSLSDAAKSKLGAEESLLLSLLEEIIAFENSEFLDFESDVHDSLYTGTIVMNDRTWYANNVAISNSTSYDVWRDTRSLALKMGSYYQSQDFFINGVDKLTLYHGALNYNNGSSFAFKIEYALSTAPNTWLTLQEGGNDLIVDVISGNPMTYAEIDVNIFESVNIRFTPVISNTSDYINLDDIRIYEHVVTSELEATTFTTVYAGILAKTTATVTVSDLEAIVSALSAYDLLSPAAQTSLTTEKALLDSLYDEVITQEQIIDATNAVVLAETSYLQQDVDTAYALVIALPSGTIKTDLMTRLDVVQGIIDDVSYFRSNYQTVLSLTVETVQVTDKSMVETALAAYSAANTTVQSQLGTEYALLVALLQEINNQLPTATLVQEFRDEHQVVLALTISTVTVGDQLAIEQALIAYDLLTSAAQTELISEKALLDSLIIKVAELEALDAVVLAETTYQQTDHDQAVILVSALPDGTYKTDLINRLQVVQQQINTDAAQFVDGLIQALPLPGNILLTDEPDVIAARSAYEALTPVQQGLVSELSVLVAAETELTNLSLATNAVITAEASLLQSDVNIAQTLINALTNGTPKTSLQNRLNAVQDIIDVNQAQSLILTYFQNNTVTVSRLTSNTIKANAFTAKANEVVTGLGVTITITNSTYVNRNNSIYTITVSKNAASVSFDVSVNFVR